MWNKAKQLYYSIVDSKRANGQLKWDQEQLVERCVTEIKKETVINIAKSGWDRLFAAEPIDDKERPWEAVDAVHYSLAQEHAGFTNEQIPESYADAV